jgi:hypothetical protein
MKGSMGNAVGLRRMSSAGLWMVLAPVAMLCTPAALAQGQTQAETAATRPVAGWNAAEGESTSAATARADLPEDPSAGAQEAGEPAPQIAPRSARWSGPAVPRSTKYISWGYSGQPISARDKVMLGARDLYSPFTFLGELASAGHSQLVNGQPNYGTDKGAFGERLGAAVLRDSSEGAFTDMVFAPLLHEDPRYFAEGPRYNVLHRALYAITRPLITRTDTGRNSINGAMLGGYAAAIAVSSSYYPKINRNFKDATESYAGSLEGAAIGFAVSEFEDDVFEALHLEKKRP